jgi:hypothetical protein
MIADWKKVWRLKVLGGKVGNLDELEGNARKGILGGIGSLKRAFCFILVDL